ncbi:Ubiquitin carboxyl-terminal hydrolase 34 [Sesbania bispinosa]|nr:Ubiquitin carboxyl-terminal hydrolase 34 [Sesbania bispinosa]
MAAQLLPSVSHRRGTGRPLRSRSSPSHCSAAVSGGSFPAAAVCGLCHVVPSLGRRGCAASLFQLRASEAVAMKLQRRWLRASKAVEMKLPEATTMKVQGENGAAQ